MKITFNGKPYTGQCVLHVISTGEEIEVECKEGKLTHEVKEPCMLETEYGWFKTEGDIEMNRDYIAKEEEKKPIKEFYEQNIAPKFRDLIKSRNEDKTGDHLKQVTAKVDSLGTQVSQFIDSFTASLEKKGNDILHMFSEKVDHVHDEVVTKLNMGDALIIDDLKKKDGFTNKRIDGVKVRIEEVAKSIPKGGILDYEVDDEKVTDKNLRTALKTKMEIENKKQNGGVLFGGNPHRGEIEGTLSNQTDLQAELDAKADALTADQNYVSDAELTVLQNTSGVNTGDQDLTGYVNTTGTPVDNYIAVFTDADTVEGTDRFTWNNSTRALSIGIAGGSNNQIITPTGVGVQGGGRLSIVLGSAGTSGAGGRFSIDSGTGKDTGSGGNMTLQAGVATGTGTGGSYIMASGSSTGGNGGDFTMFAGDGNLTTGTGGAITITAGNGFTKGTFNLRQRAGQYVFAADGSATATKQATLDFSAITGSAKSFAFPNTSGTVALTANVATIALDNLASVAINESLISDTDNTDDLGSDAIKWRTGYFGTGVKTFGRIDARFLGEDYQGLMIGESAGNLSGTGDFNIGIGRLVLQSFTTGSSNVGIGDQALTSLTEGFDNYAVGVSALGALTDGDQNTAIGTGAGQFGNPTGITAIGYQALRNANYNQAVGIGYATATAGGGFYGTIIGGGAGQSITGQKNVAIGSFAGYEITSGTQNVILGNEAGGGLGNVSNKLIIHNTTSATPLIYGDFSARTLRANGQLSALSSTGTQLTLHYDGSQSATFGVGGGGALTIRPSGLYTDLDSLTINLGDINGSANFTRFSLIDGTPEIKAEFGGSLTYYNSQVSDYFMLKFVAGGEDFGTRKYYWNANTLIEEKMSDWSAEVEASALLELRSNNATGYGHKGFLPPRMTEEQRDSIASPAIGLLIVNTDTNPETLDMYTSSGRLKLTPA